MTSPGQEYESHTFLGVGSARYQLSDDPTDGVERAFRQAEQSLAADIPSGWSIIQHSHSVSKVLVPEEKRGGLVGSMLQNHPAYIDVTVQLYAVARNMRAVAPPPPPGWQGGPPPPSRPPMQQGPAVIGAAAPALGPSQDPAAQGHPQARQQPTGDTPPRGTGDLRW